MASKTKKKNVSVKKAVAKKPVKKAVAKKPVKKAVAKSVKKAVDKSVKKAVAKSVKKAVAKKPVKKAVKKKPVKKGVKKVNKAVVKKPVKKAVAKQVKKTANSRQKIVLPKRFQVSPKSVVIVYGMRIDERKILSAAVEAYNRKRYTVNDIRLSDYKVEDLKFKNLMVKIAVLDRIEEEILRVYPQAECKRPNTVTLLVD